MLEETMKKTLKKLGVFLNMDRPSKMSEKELIKNLEQIKTLCEENAPMIASMRLQFLINDVKNEKKDI
jgi:hypothetical protein|tara:strand:+ start:306 stop:509 length:204 start_codon:yes stop_codon:yes gene_type:complete